ncbi:MAG: hypothetical protein HFI93_07870 [Lachnospiraceae bacterium]|nr:hypothetical protein [Lachnospiraceae bacterium]
MLPVSHVNAGYVRPVTAAEREDEAAKAQEPQEKEREHSFKPVKDEYIPEEKNEPAGRPGRPDKKSPEDIKGEERTCNTDKVDREIEKLKKKKQKLEQQINTETDESRKAELEKELAQVESELKQKDNDAYRRQHATFT